MATGNKSGSSHFSSAFQSLAFGSGLIVVCCLVTLGLLKLNQNDARRDREIAEDSQQTSSGPALPEMPPEGLFVGANSNSPQGEIVRAGGVPVLREKPWNMTDVRLERIELQLDRIARQADPRWMNPPSPSGLCCPPFESEQVERAIIQNAPITLTQALSETIRTATAESSFRRELSDLRVASELSLEGIRQQLKGISERQKTLKESLLEMDLQQQHAQKPSVQQADKSSLFAAFEETMRSRGVESDLLPKEKPAITVVSKKPLRIDVHSRSTTLADLLSEFAQATGSDLVMASEQDHTIQAISLSSIDPRVLFDLLDQNQKFEILFEGNRVSLQPRPKEQIAEASDPRPSPLDLAEAALEIEPAEVAPSSVESTATATAETTEKLTPLIDETDIPLTKQPNLSPAPQKGKIAVRETPAPSRAELRKQAIAEAKKLKPETSAPLPVTSPVSMPADSGDEADLLKPLAPIESPLKPVMDPRAASAAISPTPPISTSKLASVAPVAAPVAQPPDLEPTPTPLKRPARTRRQRYELFATVMHITLTNTQAVEPEGLFPIELHVSRRPGHASAVRQVLDQAGRIGRVTPVTEASVRLDEGQAARLKIGSQCLHCNTEYGVEAGDTLRVGVHQSPSGQPRLRVQGLAAGSSEPLGTLSSFESAVPESQSFLVSEEGTAGYVDVEEKSSKLTKLPLIGHRFEKTNRVRQIAQRFIVLTLRPAGYTEVAQAPASRAIEPASRLEEPRFAGTEPWPQDVYSKKLRAVSRSLTESEREAAQTAPAPRPIQFTLPSLPVPAMPTGNTPNDDIPSVPPVDEMPIPESEAVGLTQAPPAEEEAVLALVSHEVSATRKVAAEPRPFNRHAVEAAREVVSPPRAATPTTRVVEMPQIPTFQRKRPQPESKPASGVRQASHTHSSHDDCPECRKLFHRDPKMRKLVPAPSRLVRRLPDSPRPGTRESLKTRFTKFREGLEFPVPDDF